MKASPILFILCMCAAIGAKADELYKVTLHSDQNAATLRSINADIVLAVRDGYLIRTSDIQS